MYKRQAQHGGHLVHGQQRNVRASSFTLTGIVVRHRVIHHHMRHRRREILRQRKPFGQHPGARFVGGRRYPQHQNARRPERYGRFFSSLDLVVYELQVCHQIWYAQSGCGLGEISILLRRDDSVLLSKPPQGTNRLSVHASYVGRAHTGRARLLRERFGFFAGDLVVGEGLRKLVTICGLQRGVVRMRHRFGQPVHQARHPAALARAYGRDTRCAPSSAR